MPPKVAKSSAMSEEVYYLYASLRVLMAQTGTSPNWDVVSESLGGTTKSHTLYCRLDTLKKKAMPAFGDNLPDLNTLIDDHVAAGTISKKGAKTASASKATPKTPRAKKILEENEDEDDNTPTAKSSRKRAATPAAKGRGKKAKVDEAADEEDEDDLLTAQVKSEPIEEQIEDE